MLRLRRTMDSYIYRRGNWPTNKGQVNVYLNLELAVGYDQNIINSNGTTGATVKELRIYDVFDGDYASKPNERSRLYLKEMYAPPYTPDLDIARMAVVLYVSKAPIETIKQKYNDKLAIPRPSGMEGAGTYIEDDQYFHNYIDPPLEYNAIEGSNENDNFVINICGSSTESIVENYPYFDTAPTTITNLFSYNSSNTPLPPSGGGGLRIKGVQTKDSSYYYYTLKNDASIDHLYFLTDALRYMTEAAPSWWPNHKDFPRRKNYWTNWFPHSTFYEWNIDFELDKKSIQITDNSCKNEGNGILKDNKDTVGIEVTGGATIDYIDVMSTNPDSKLQFDWSLTGSNRGIVTVTSNKNPINYPYVETVIISGVVPDETNSFTVNFYERVSSVTLNSSNTLSINIKDTGLQSGYSISGYNPQTINTTSDRKLAMDGGYISPALSRSFTPINNNTFLDVRQYLSLIADSNNFFKLSGERDKHTIQWTFFNHFVNNYLNNSNKLIQNNEGYHKTLETTIYWYITPADINQFSFDWLNSSNQVTTPPEAILPDFDLPTPGNLKYLNNTTEGGYCRAFRLDYYNQSGTKLKSSVFYATEDTNKVANYLGKVITRTSLVDLPYNEPITVKITMCFYYDRTKETLHDGVSTTLSQKLYRIKKDDILPTLVFPLVSNTAPYTPLMLTEVERFGYNLPDLLLSLKDGLDIDFGVLVNNQAYTIRDNPNYFSSSDLTSNIVVDIGRIVKDDSINLTQCSVVPFIKIFASDKNNTQIVYRTENTQLSNVIINTSLNTMWYRPTVDSGELTTYYDYDRFMQFINKYRYLYNNQVYTVPTNKQGEIINTNFWTSVATELDKYAKAMQLWATDVTNFVILWALPEFMHQKGEIITNNNLYQNYYDLLVQHDGHASFATHDYLNENKYTHNTLGNYTHEQISNKEGI